MKNMEIVQPVVKTAQEEGSPVILQASQGAIKYAGLDYILGIARAKLEMKEAVREKMRLFGCARKA